MNSLNQVYRHVCTIDPLTINQKNTTAFLVGRIRSEYQYKHIETIEGNVQAFIDHILNALDEIGAQMQKEFFHY